MKHVTWWTIKELFILFLITFVFLIAITFLGIKNPLRVTFIFLFLGNIRILYIVKKNQMK